jgi:hypothetical protein
MPAMANNNPMMTRAAFKKFTFKKDVDGQTIKQEKKVTEKRTMVKVLKHRYSLYPTGQKRRVCVQCLEYAQNGANQFRARRHSQFKRRIGRHGAGGFPDYQS